MTIVRELLTKIGFTFDKTELDKFEKSILGFKTKFSIAAIGIGAAFSKIIDRVSEFSDKTLNTNAIAKLAKSSNEELTALTNVLSKAGISQEKTLNHIEETAQNIKKTALRIGNPFLDLVTESGKKVRSFVNGQLTDSVTALKDFVQYIKFVGELNGDEKRQLEIIRDYMHLTAQEAESFLTLLKDNNFEFDKLIEREKASLGNLQGNLDAAREFKKEINSLSVEWEKFSNIVAKTVAPFITREIKGLNNLIETGSFSQYLQETFPHLTGHLKTARAFLGEEKPFENYFNNPENFVEKISKKQQYENNLAGFAANAANVTNNVNFEISVPYGTTEEQAKYMNNEVYKAIQSYWDEKTREVINNNPMVE